MNFNLINMFSFINQSINQSDPKYFCAKCEGESSCTSDVNMVISGHEVRMLWAARGVENRVTKKMFLSLTPCSLSTFIAVCTVAPVSRGGETHTRVNQHHDIKHLAQEIRCWCTY